MKYNFFQNLSNNFVGHIENIDAYNDLFSSVNIVPGEIIMENISKDVIGENLLCSCITTKGLVLNFFIGNIYMDEEYKDYLCGVYFIYNNKYFLLRNIGYDRNKNLTFIVDFYDTDKLEQLRTLLPPDKSYIEPNDFTRHEIKRDVTFDITLAKYDLYTLESQEEDLIKMISSMGYDRKVRTRQDDGDLPFVI